MIILKLLLFYFISHYLIFYTFFSVQNFKKKCVNFAIHQTSVFFYFVYRPFSKEVIFRLRIARSNLFHGLIESLTRESFFFLSFLILNSLEFFFFLPTISFVIFSLSFLSAHFSALCEYLWKSNFISLRWRLLTTNFYFMLERESVEYFSIFGGSERDE